MRPQCHDLFKCVRKPKTVDLIRSPPSQTVRKTGSYMVEPWLVFGQVRNKKKVIVAIKKTRTPLTATSSLLLPFKSRSLSAERKQDYLDNQQTNSILRYDSPVLILNFLSDYSR